MARTDMVPPELGTLGAVSDLGTVIQHTEENIGRGLDPTEAAVVATAQTMAGNAAMASGVADPRSSLVGQALLPTELRGILPDAVVENFAGTGYEAARRRAGGARQPRRRPPGRPAIDRFAESVANREGTDPFKGYAMVGEALGEEMARTDGGSLWSDLDQIRSSGAGTAVINERLDAFVASVEGGEHGAPLEGIAYLTNIAAEVIVDPSKWMNDVANDCQSIWDNGVGDDYWSKAVDTSVSAITRTPLIGTVAQGVAEIASGIGESGVSGFATEMAEGPPRSRPSPRRPFTTRPEPPPPGSEARCEGPRADLRALRPAGGNPARARRLPDPAPGTPLRVVRQFPRPLAPGEPGWDALRARGLVVPDGDAWRVNLAIRGVLAACVRPDEVIDVGVSDPAIPGFSIVRRGPIVAECTVAAATTKLAFPLTRTAVIVTLVGALSGDRPEPPPTGFRFRGSPRRRVRARRGVARAA